VASRQQGVNGASARDLEGDGVASHAADEKWYEAPIAAAALGVVTLVLLVVFLTLTFRSNPNALVKVLGAVATLAGALAGLVYGTQRGKKQGRKETGSRVLPVLKDVQAELERHDRQLAAVRAQLREESEAEQGTEAASGQGAWQTRIPDHPKRSDSPTETSLKSAISYLEKITGAS
jgi:hypothetical protein